MNVKTTVYLPEYVMRFAEKMVEDGLFPSIDSVLAASLEEMMASQLSPDMDPVVDRIADEMRRRMTLPEDQWIPWDGQATLERIRKRRADERSR